MEYTRKSWLSSGSVVVAAIVIMGGADWAAAKETQVNTYTVNAQRDPSVAMDLNTGSFVTAWQGPDQNGDGVFMDWPLDPPIHTDSFESGDFGDWIVFPPIP